jgi:protein required for attachment to host cells
MRLERTWIVIANGRQAKVFESHGRNSDLVPLDEMVFVTESPPNREIEDDGPGRSFESANPARHAMQNRTDPHRELKRAFARNLASRLDQELKCGSFDHLVIVAPPVTLGDLRDALSQQSLDKVSAELAKDLMKVPPHDLAPHLETIWEPRGKRH